jgi:hypothetical protein
MSHNIHGIHANDAGVAGDRWYWGLVLLIGLAPNSFATESAVSIRDMADTTVMTAGRADSPARQAEPPSPAAGPPEHAHAAGDSTEEDCE